MLKEVVFAISDIGGTPYEFQLYTIQETSFWSFLLNFNIILIDIIMDGTEPIFLTYSIFFTFLHLPEVKTEFIFFGKLPSLHSF